MTDFAVARRMMVEGQVRTSDVTDSRLIGAMLDLPREQFVAPSQAALAYLDFDVLASDSAGQGSRRLLKPMVLAKLIQAADIVESERVLDVACATGYSSAVLSRLAGTVVALEEDAGLARRAEDNLRALGVANVTVATAPLTQGWAASAPYDVIFINGALEIEPPELLRQLAEGGRLVTVKGRGPGSHAMLYRRIGSDVSGWPVFDGAAPLLPGFAAPVEFVF